MLTYNAESTAFSEYPNIFPTGLTFVLYLLSFSQKYPQGNAMHRLLPICFYFVV